MYPLVRMRRFRRNETLRRMVRETMLSPSDFIYPLFVRPGRGVRNDIASMPGVAQLSPDLIVEECGEVASLGIPGVLLFGIPSHKDEVGSEAYDDEGIIQEAVRAIKKSYPDLAVITDVCLCEYTSHGHCGLIENGDVANDPSLPLLAKMALSHAKAGADIVAPSDMMDGRVGAIRAMLDENGFSMTPIMSYAAKYASGFYGPFREAAEGAPRFGDRRSYQMDPPNAREAIREVELDLAEGADMVIVKPALPYLDILSRVRQTFSCPVAAYNVSGEYAMVKAAAANGWLDERRVAMEVLTGIKRAGADLIITYHSKDACRWLAEG
jgi:porphobilinogen synthase